MIEVAVPLQHSLMEKKIQKSNMASSYVKDNWQKVYDEIYNRIFELAKKYSKEHLVKIKLILEQSLIDDKWITNLQINGGNFIEQNIHSRDKNFRSVEEITVFPRTNHFSLYVKNQFTGKYEVNWTQGISIPPDTKKMTLAKDGDTLSVYYNDEFPKSKVITTQSSNNLDDPIIEQQNLNQLGPSDYLDIHLNIDQEETFQEFNLTINYKNENTDLPLKLIQTFGSLVDSYTPINYVLIKTEYTNAPYLLYYSGQAGDEYNVDGKLILFNPSKVIAELDLNSGNRIESKLLEVNSNMIKVREAFMCHQGIHSKVEISDKGISRTEGFFPENTFYPNPDNKGLSATAQLSANELKTDLIVNQGGQQIKYSKGTKISIQLLSVDYSQGQIILKINQAEVTMSIENFKNHEFPQSMHGAKCEMG